jgi:glyoxylase-like metal-dependent hydrolase (beta-lactamase superfamily II)
MVHEILVVGSLECNCSIFGDEVTREALVVDPGADVERILEMIEHHGLTVKAIVVTHAHIDHIGGAQQLKIATGAPIHMHPDDTELCDMLGVQAAWLGLPAPELAVIDTPLADGGTLALGGATFHVLHTPGHSPGSVSLWLPAERKLMAGDTLFRDSIGRTDLPGGDGRRILRSIREKLLVLPEETVVFPGHGETTTIGRELRYNYFLQGL